MKSDSQSDSTNKLTSLSRVRRAVVISQALFTAGNSLTTGGFLYYFINDFHPSAFLFALLQIAPETSEAFSSLSRWVMTSLGNRKWIYIVGLVIARCVALLIPLALFWTDTESTTSPVYFVLTCVILWHLFQGISYLSLISWLTDLVPEQNWGNFFARQRMSHLAIMVSVPVAMGLLRKYTLAELPAEMARISYAVIFGLGGMFCLASLVPMLKFQNVPWRSVTQTSGGTMLDFLKLNRSLHFLLASRWWLAFFQGFSQVILFQYSVKILKVELETYYLLSAVMYGLQFPCTWQAGRWSDRSRDKHGLALGMVVAGSGLIFFLIATPDQQWVLIGAYSMWGAFGWVNVCGANLCLKLSPEGDNVIPFSLYRQTSGLIAGLTGLLGGLVLDKLLAANPTSQVFVYQLLIAISCLGRTMAPLWLFGVKQPQRSDAATMC